MRYTALPIYLALVAAIGCGDAGSAGDGAPASDGGSARDGAAKPDAAGTGDDGGTGDVYLPWEGGPAYYSHWTHGPSSDPSFFPVAVWLQSPSNAAKYQAIGVNTFIGLFDGPTDQQLSDLAAAKMPAVCDQADDWAKHLTDPTIIAWQQQDEPDNAQPDGNGGYGPCIDPSVIQMVYQTFTKNDASRPVYLNLGQGVAYDDYIGRGSACGGKLDMYAKYEMGADIVSLDIYPDNNTDVTTHKNLWFVAQGVDRLRMWAAFQKPVWNWIETTKIDGQAAADTQPTPDDTRAEVWMSIIHGSRGIGYFVHKFNPFVEPGIFDDPAMTAAVKTLDQQIHDLAPVLNTPPIGNGATVSTSDGNNTVDIQVKRSGGALYLFAVAMRPVTTTATFTLRQGGTSATVIDESRTIPVAAGKFQDSFTPYAVHLYKITP